MTPRTKAKRLEAEFHSRSIRDARAFSFDGETAVAFINRAADEGVPVLGVQAMRATSGKVKPGEDLIDFSGEVGQGHGCWEEAEAFVRARTGSATAFQVVLGDDPVEAV